jgi:hypothetical protein
MTVYQLVAIDLITDSRQIVNVSRSRRDLEDKAGLARAIDPFTVFEVSVWANPDERKKQEAQANGDH